MSGEISTVKIKKLSKHAVVPKKQREGDAAFDLTATSKHYEKREDGARVITYGTDVAIQLPKGHVGLIFPRSSVANSSLTFANSVGVIDENYTGEITFKFKLDAEARPFKDATYEIGDRIGQLLIIPYPTIEFEEVDGLDETERGDGAYGSSGR